MSLAHQRHVVFENGFRAGDVGRLAFDFERAVDQMGADLQPGLEQADVFIARAEEALDAADDGHVDLHLADVRILQVIHG